MVRGTNDPPAATSARRDCATHGDLEDAVVTATMITCSCTDGHSDRRSPFRVTVSLQRFPKGQVQTASAGEPERKGAQRFPGKNKKITSQIARPAEHSALGAALF